MAPKPISKGKTVTLIAGFKCTDGYVICSDSQETVGDMRAPADKLSIWTAGGFEIAIAGSGGSGDLIDACEERIRDGLSNSQDVSSLRSLKDFIHDELHQFQKTEAVLHPKPDRVMRFVIGARSIATGECVLWSSKATRLREVPEYALVGFWDERYRFAVEAYLKPNPAPTIAQGIFLGLYVMWLAEQTSNYVKAPVHVALVRGGQFVREKQDKINAMLERVKLFGAQFDKLFLACPDTGLQHGEFAERLSEFVKSIVHLRKEYVEEWVGKAVEEGLDKVIEPYNLIAPGQVIVVNPTPEQAASHRRMQEDLQTSLRNNFGYVQERDRIIYNLRAIQVVLQNLLGKYKAAAHEPTEQEKIAYNKAHGELLQASLMGPYKEGENVVALLQNVVSFLQTNREDLTGYGDTDRRDAVHLVRFSIVECALASLQTTTPSNSQTLEDRQ